MYHYKMPESKRAKSFRLLESYILQQRKKNIEVYTNDLTMKNILEDAYPNIVVVLLQISIQQTDVNPINVDGYK